MVYKFDLNKSTAHVAVIGGSGKGKSVYARAIVQQQVNKKYIAEEDVLVFTTKSNQLSGDWAGFKCYDSLETQFDNIWKDYTEVNMRPCLIILDDFLNDKNFNANVKNIERLFTEGRKNRIHGLMTSHTANSINNKCRGCINYVALFPSFDNTEIERYADSYVNGDYRKLTELFNQAKKEGMYTCVVRDPQGQFILDKCNPQEDLTQQTNDVSGTQSQNINQNAQINGSNNNLTQVNISPLMLQQKEIAQKNEFERMERVKEAAHQREMKKVELVYETHDLIKKLHKSGAERLQMINNLNILSLRGGVNEKNVPYACMAFFQKYFPDEEYHHMDNEDVSSILDSVAPDNKLARSAINYFVREQDRQSLNTLGTAASSFIGGSLSNLVNFFSPEPHKPMVSQVSFGYEDSQPDTNEVRSEASTASQIPNGDSVRVLTDEHYELYRILNGTLDYNARLRSIELLNKLRRNPMAEKVTLKNLKERAQVFKQLVFYDDSPVIII